MSVTSVGVTKLLNIITFQQKGNNLAKLYSFDSNITEVTLD